MSKKKILLLSDDLRMHSGIATQSQEFVLGTLHHYDWVQIGAAINHPDNGKVIDMSEALEKEHGIKGYLKIYPSSGYGNEQMLREIMAMEKPDAIVHFTDPRFWQWLYQMEHEIRQDVPIMYYNIWDDLPDPYYNEYFYRSSDLLMAISKQTYGINKRILSDYEDWQIKYVPHGVSERRFTKLQSGDLDIIEMKTKLGIENNTFNILYLNRNIRRKQPGDFLLAYKYFMDKLTPEERKECALIFHATPVDDNGTDVPACVKALLPEEYKVVFTHTVPGFAPLDSKGMNLLNNTVDVYMNLASNEGFGLGSLEALTCGKPIIVNVTGGLQDQCGFKKDGKYLTGEDYIELQSNHRGTYKEHGEWASPIFPSNISLQGSPPTPYIFDDRCRPEDAADALYELFKAGPEERERRGEIGRQWVLGDDARMTGKHMSDSFIEAIDGTFENWKPRKKYTMEVI
ncbi:MAG: hypothetical protein CMB78_06280 [Euryarchaeota archaeon]|nr:hypothetical protein [Euryarchaeota archaeon]|tara:strand:- start:707 stop:2077 length:1371 start_codon:yes stop_codon:yes gene_type:complete